MKKSIVRKPISILLSLLMVLSVFGGMAFSASAENETEGYDIVLNSTWTEEWYDITYTPSQTNIPAGTQVSVVLTKKYSCVKYANIRSLRTSDSRYFSLDATENGYRADFEMPDADLTLYVTDIGVTHEEGRDLFADMDAEHPYTANGQTATGYDTALCRHCGKTQHFRGMVTAYLIDLSTTDPTVSLSFFHFADTDEARQNPMPASEYAIPNQYVYFKINVTSDLPDVRITALKETDPQDPISFTCTNGYYRFTMPEYPVQVSTGNLVQFGTYPQTRVEETPALKAAAEKATWKSYGYYSGTGDYRDGMMTPDDYMKFADFFVGTEKYRAVLFTKWRPFYTGYTAGANVNHSWQKYNGYFENTTYYFKYEPLTWRILDPTEGLILCESIIDSQAFNNTWYYDSSNYHYYQAIGSEVDANDYASSSIRSWLNEDFYRTAFNDAQKANIETSELIYDKHSESGSYAYDVDTITDKIFMLSYAQATNPDYGFTSDNAASDSRVAFSTDYAACQGLPAFQSANSSWRLLTADTYTGSVFYVNKSGELKTQWAPQTDTGVRPACKLTALRSDISAYSYLYSAGTHGHIAGKIVVENETSATCTEDGSRTVAAYCTECGAFVGRETTVIDAFGHTEAYPVSENEVDPTCTEAGSYDVVTYCETCGEELYRVAKTQEAFGHTPGAATVENFVAPTTEAAGSYDIVTFCAVCEEVIERETVSLDKLAPSDVHVAGTPVVENYVAPTTETEGSFDVVVYCADCGEELSRETMTTPKLTPSDTPDMPDTPDTPDTPDQPSGGESSGKVCPWCGETKHDIWWIGFVHSVFSFVKVMFEKLKFTK